MRILYTLDSYRPNIDGVGVSIERQAQGLAARGHAVAIIAPAQRMGDYEETAGDIKVYRARAVKMVMDHWRVAVKPGPSVEWAVRSFAPNVVVVSLPLPLNLCASQLARDLDLPLVGITSTMPEWFLYSFWILQPFSRYLNPQIWRLLAKYYNRCDTVVGVTATALGYLRDHGLTRPSRVISNGVQLDKFCPRPWDEALAEQLGIPAKPIVLYAGRLDSEKRMDVWIKGIPHVLKEVDAHFVIGGDGTERGKLEDLVDQLGVREHVTFPGFLDEERYPRLYSLASVFAIASPAELQSIVTLEAASSGLPIVGANAGALPELVQEGRNGLLFEPGNSEQLADRIVQVLNDGVRRRRMGNESRVIARQHDFNFTVRAYERVYDEVVNGRSVGLGFRPRPGTAHDEIRS